MLTVDNINQSEPEKQNRNQISEREIYDASNAELKLSRRVSF